MKQARAKKREDEEEKEKRGGGKESGKEKLEARFNLRTFQIWNHNHTLATHTLI